MNVQQELLNTESKIPLMGVPVTIAEYFCNVPPNEINGQRIYYMRADDGFAENIIFYAENKNGEMSFFEVLDLKGDCRIDGKNVYKRVFITPVFPFVEIKEA